jgi:hypothetical protein
MEHGRYVSVAACLLYNVFHILFHTRETVQIFLDIGLRITAFNLEIAPQAEITDPRKYAEVHGFPLCSLSVLVTFSIGTSNTSLAVSLQ